MRITKNISNESNTSSISSEDIFNMKATAQKVKTPGEHINSSKSSEEELIEDNGTFSYGAGAEKTVSFELKQQREKLKKNRKDDTTAEAIDILSPTTTILNQRTQNKESKNGGKGAKILEVVEEAKGLEAEEGEEEEEGAVLPQ